MARRFLARGWVPVQFCTSGFRRVARRFPARGWVLAEQTCIARGSPVHPKLGCVEMPFHCGIARGSLRLTPLACLEMLAPLSVRQADGLLRARHGVDLLADEEIQGRVYSPQCPARTPRPLVPASPSASQPPVLKLRGLAASLPYRAASNIHGAGIFAKLTFANKDQSLPP